MRPVPRAVPHAPGVRVVRVVRVVRLAAVCGVAGLCAAACASTPAGPRSWVDPSAARTSSDAAPIGAAVARFVASRIPPATSTLVLLPPPDEQRAQPGAAAVAIGVADALRRTGFAVAPEAGGSAPGATAGGVHRVRYLVTPLATSGGDRVLLRVQLDGRAEAARLFRRDTTGALTAAAPLTVREGS